jgi:pyruvate formate-lyase/glycerol dehydratase family glycyl radical enzyme
VTQSVVRTFKDLDFGAAPLLNRLKASLLEATPHICIERARHITNSLRSSEGSGKPMQLRYAEAVRTFLCSKEAFYFDDNLLAGTTTSKPFGAPLFPELTGMTIWPELDSISARQKNPMVLSKADAGLLDQEIFPYWMQRNILEIARKQFNEPPCMKLFERLIFFIAGKAGCISHTVPEYTLALRHGVRFLIAKAACEEAAISHKAGLTAIEQEQLIFYQSVQIALGGIIAYAQTLGRKARESARKEENEGRRENLRAMAAVCSRVPARGARSFREALNSLWLLQIAIHAENINMAISPGRLDQILYPYYEYDITRGRLTHAQALELLGCFWLKLNDNTNVVPESAEEMFGGAGTVPAVTLGGVDQDGNDAVNELTYLMLRVTELMQTRDPSVNARYHHIQNSVHFRDRIAEVIASTKAVPAVHNDVADIAALVNQGVTLPHARDYAIIGCVELSSGGRSFDASCAIMLVLPSILQLALNDGRHPLIGDVQIGPRTGDPHRFTAFEQFWSAFERQYSWVAGQAVELNNLLGRVHQEALPSPLLSSLFEGPMVEGRDLTRGGGLYNSSGATHIGFADTVDSLCAIEEAVFTAKKCSMKELCGALANDFAGQESLRMFLLHQTPKFGTRSPGAGKIAKRLVRLIYEFLNSRTNYRGGKYRPAFWTMTNHAGQGRLCGALPNGRKSGAAFASGITPVSQVPTDLAACLSAVAKLDGLCIPGGEALNLKFPGVTSRLDIKRLGDTIEAYFRLGGLQVQFNIVTAETLRDAKAHPKKYPGLLVRVSGYSAYFNDLNDKMKDEIIARTAFDLRSGRTIPA